MRKDYVHKVTNVPIEYQGETKSLRAWCQLFGLTYTTVRMRYVRGERDIDRLFKPTPVPKKGWMSPYDKKKQSKRIAENTMPTLFYGLHADVRQAIFDFVGHDKDKVQKLMIQAVELVVKKKLMNKQAEAN